MTQALFRTMRWGLTGIVVLLVIVLLTVELVPWNFLKSPIIDKVESVTGRDLDISGNVSLGLLPRPHIELEQLALANAPWASRTEMLTVQEARITPSLGSLLKGNLVLERIELTQPVLNLEGRKQKPGNWLLPGLTAAEDKTGTEDQKQGNDNPFPVRQLHLSEAKVRYRPTATATPWVVSVPSLQVSRNRVSLQARVFRNSRDTSLGLPMELDAQYQPGFSDGQWHLSNIRALINKSEINGRLALDTRAPHKPRLTGELHSTGIDVAALRSAIPGSQDSSSDSGLSVPVLPGMTGSVRLRADQIRLPRVVLENMETNLTLSGHQLKMESLGFEVAGGTIEATASITSSTETLEAAISGNARQIDLHQLGIGEEAGHLFSADFEFGLEPVNQTPAPTPGNLLEHINVRKLSASYKTATREPENASDLALSLSQDGEESAPQLTVRGEFQGKPLDMTLQGAPLPALLGGLASYPVKGQAQSGDLTAHADFQLDAFLSPATFSANVELNGTDGSDLDAWIVPSLPLLPEYRIAGQLSRNGQRWSVTSLEGEIGTAGFTGEAHFQTTDPPFVDVSLNADRIELSQFLNRGEGSGSEHNTNTTSEGESPLAPLLTVNGELELKANTLLLPDGPALKDFQLAGNLQSGQLDLAELDFRAGGGTWHSTLGLNASEEPASGTLKATFDSMALSQFGDTFTTIEDRLGRLSGNLDLAITQSLPDQQSEDLVFPSIGRLIIEPSSLRFTDPEYGTDLVLKLESRSSQDGERALHVNGEGRYDGAPVSLTFRGDPPLDARDPDRPYSLLLSGDIVDTDIRIQGSILRPLALKGLDLQIDLAGPNPQRLSRLLGLPLPELPDYAVSGELSLDNRQWRIENLSGDVGDSDIKGRLGIDTAATPPHLSARLRSDSLLLADLVGLTGHSAGRSSESATQDEDDASSDQDVLPDATLISDNWRKLTADVRYRGKSVRAADIPLSNVVIDFTLNEGQALLEPLRFGVGDGHVDFNLKMDIGSEQPEGTLQLEVKAVNLDKALRDWPIADGTVGTVGGQGKFWVTGASVGDMFATADGGLVLLMTGGRLSALLVELAGVDIAQAFTSWLSGRDPLPIDCAYADLQAREGVIRVDTLAVDTSDTTFTGTGTSNMNDERLDLTIEAHPKDVSVLSARTPLHISGTFNDPDFGVEEGELALRAGGSAVLAALASPVTALLPLLDLGSGNEVPYCDGLVSRSKEAINDD